MMYKVLIANHNPVLQQGLALILQKYDEFQVIGEVTNAKELFTLLEQTPCDVIITEVFALGAENIDQLKCLHQKYPEIKILALTESKDENDMLKVIQSGAKGCLPVSVGIPELIDSLRLVAGNNAVVYTSLAIKNNIYLHGLRKAKASNGSLSKRETEVLQLVASGASNKEIAERCFVSETTVKAHLRRISDKLDVRNRAQAVATAIEKGLLKLS